MNLPQYINCYCCRIFLYTVRYVTVADLIKPEWPIVLQDFQVQRMLGGRGEETPGSQSKLHGYYKVKVKELCK